MIIGKLAQKKQGARYRLRGIGWGATAIALGATMCGALSATPASAASTTTLTLYSGQHVQTTQALVNGFEKKTGIKVKIRSDDEDVLADQIETEGSRSPADLFFTENSPPLQVLASKGLLASVDPSTLSKTPARFDSPQGKWVGITARVSVLVYNTNLIKKSQLPMSAMQLANPKWKGKLAVAGGETDFQPIVTSVVRAHGQAAALKWLEAYKANAGSHSYPDNETLVDKVNQGQAAIGIINEYYWYRERDLVGASNMHSALAYFAPHDVGYVIDVSGAAILKSSTHQAAAQQVLAYLNSAAGQQIINHGQSWEYPIASGVQRTGETPFNQLKPNAISIAQLGTGAEAIKLLQEAQLL
ncbi:MAG TPA: extracellular solute-binding protein [Acidimicrobiales bacterium]